MNKSDSILPTFSALDGRLAIKPGEALWVAGLSSSLAAARKTARNRISDGRFPFPVRHLNGRALVLVADIFQALGLLPQPEATKTARGPGRPRKAAPDGAHPDIQ